MTNILSFHPTLDVSCHPQLLKCKFVDHLTPQKALPASSCEKKHVTRYSGAEDVRPKNHPHTFLNWEGTFLANHQDQQSGQIIIFHQPRFPWNKWISPTTPLFGVRSCEVAIIWPEQSTYLNMIKESTYLFPVSDHQDEQVYHSFPVKKSSLESHRAGWKTCFERLSLPKTCPFRKTSCPGDSKWTFLSPNIGDHLTFDFGSLNHPKKVTSRIARLLLFKPWKQFFPRPKHYWRSLNLWLRVTNHPKKVTSRIARLLLFKPWKQFFPRILTFHFGSRNHPKKVTSRIARLLLFKPWKQFFPILRYNFKISALKN